MLRLINGSPWSGLWAVFQYFIRRKNPAKPKAAALLTLTFATVVALLLSTLLLGADTWLHLATETLSLTQTTIVPPNDFLYSLEPSPACMLTNNSLAALQMANLSCTVRTFDDQIILSDARLTAETINNKSQSRSVSYDIHTDLSYLNPWASPPNPTLEFQASRYAVRTACKPISGACNLQVDENVTFSFSNGAFEIDDDQLVQLGYIRQVFKLSDLTDIDDDNHMFGFRNPFYVAVAAMLPAPEDSPLIEDPELRSLSSGFSGLFSCSVTVLNVEYAYRKGEVCDISATPSTTNITNMFTSAISSQPFGFDNDYIALQSAAMTAKTAEEFSQRLALALSNSILSSASGSVRLAPVHAAQRWTILVVSAIPRIPFYLLLIIDLAFVIFGLLLTRLAATTSEEGRQVQYRLTIPGIVANLFDRDDARKESTSVEVLFGEWHGINDTRVKIERTSSGGFAWSTVERQKPEVTVSDAIAPVDLSQDSRVDSLSPFRSTPHVGIVSNVSTPREPI